MNYLTLLDDLLLDAKKCGINKYAIGKELYGEQLTRLYQLKNPTVKTLENVKKAIEKIKKTKGL